MKGLRLKCLVGKVSTQQKSQYEDAAGMGDT